MLRNEDEWGKGRAYCRDCESSALAKWVSENPEKVRKNNRRAKFKSWGLDPDEVFELIKNHNGLCDICGNPAGEYRDALDVDHDHTTGELLCGHCNRGIGCFKELLANAVKYLEEVY